MTATPLDTGAMAHEHDLRLISVDYDDAGRAVREYECTSCDTVWFD